MHETPLDLALDLAAIAGYLPVAVGHACFTRRSANSPVSRSKLLCSRLSIASSFALVSRASFRRRKNRTMERASQKAATAARLTI